jgi:hypothetical protein
MPKVVERPLARHVRDLLASRMNPRTLATLRHYTMGECRILVTRDHGPYTTRWHISVSCEDRDPTWEEIKHAQNAIKPGVFFCIPMPPREHWMSIHEHTFHLEEVLDNDQVEQWKHEARTAANRAKGGV